MGQVLEDLGAKVYIADGKDFKNFKLYQAVRKKDDYTDAYYLRLFFFERSKRVWRFNKELAQHALSGLALMELNKLKVVLDWHSKLEEEITSIARNHKDYEILKSFHGLNDILIATLIAYYWDIERFKDVDSFIGYMVMGANPEVSGIAVHTSH